MPFDGISFTEPGYKITPPSEINIQSEMYSKTQAKTFVKKLDESQIIDPDSKNNKNSKNKDDQQEKNNDDESFDENSPEFVNKSKKVKKFKVTFNQTTDMVELIERETGKIIETISPNDLLTLVSKSKTASGILVDKTI